MTWRNLFSNPTTLRGRAVAALSSVDHHLNEAQRALNVLAGDPEAKQLHDDIYTRLESLRWHVRKVGMFQKKAR